MGWINPAIAGLAMMTAVSPPVAEPIDDLTETEILQLEHERYRRLTVPVTIGGHGPFNFMVDTGAQATVLSNQLADQLGIVERRPATLVGMASRRPVEVVSVDEFSLGSRSFTIRVAPLVERANIGGADGILGLDSLQRQRVLLDFENNTMLVADADTLGGNGGYEITVRARRKLGQLIISEAKIDGVRTAIVIDTGASASVGNPELLRKLRRQRDGGTALMTDINGVDLESDVRLAREVRIGRLQISNVAIAFADAPPFHALGLADEPALILGMHELRMFDRVAIDFDTRKVLFDLPRDASLANEPGNWSRTF